MPIRSNSRRSELRRSHITGEEMLSFSRSVRRVAVVVPDLNSALVCRCGSTVLSMVGPPIAQATCYCESCKTAAHQIEETGASSIVRTDSGVDYVLYRKDRVTLIRGKENLAEHRLAIDSPTRRVVTTCCQSPIFLDFTPGHWLSLFQAGSGQQESPPRVRTYTSRFFLKLIGAWIAMGFRRPKLSF